MYYVGLGDLSIRLMLGMFSMYPLFQSQTLHRSEFQFERVVTHALEWKSSIVLNLHGEHI